jgi:hypothetical protein
MKKLLFLLAGCCLALAAVRADPAHEHGVARLDIASESGRVLLDLDTPLDNLLGFEHAPRTDAERQRAELMVARLRAAATLFQIDPAAGCTLARVDLQSAALALGPVVAASKDAAHGQLEGHFEFTCKPGARAGFVEVGLFEAFAPLRRIELQVVTPKGQLKATLARPASRVALAR